MAGGVPSSLSEAANSGQHNPITFSVVENRSTPSINDLWMLLVILYLMFWLGCKGHKIVVHLKSIQRIHKLVILQGHFQVVLFSLQIMWNLKNIYTVKSSGRTCKI